MIRFTSPWRGYAPDDTATLTPAAEARLVARGVADVHVEPEPGAEPAEPTERPAAKRRTNRSAQR